MKKVLFVGGSLEGTFQELEDYIKEITVCKPNFTNFYSEPSLFLEKEYYKLMRYAVPGFFTYVMVEAQNASQEKIKKVVESASGVGWKPYKLALLFANNEYLGIIEHAEFHMNSEYYEEFQYAKPVFITASPEFIFTTDKGVYKTYGYILESFPDGHCEIRTESAAILQDTPYNKSGTYLYEPPAFTFSNSWGFKDKVSPEPLQEVVPGLNARVNCPQKCGGDGASLWTMIQHLNDRHKWTREAIADWLESLDINLEFRSTSDKD